jgi:hypothetical protein
MNETAGNRLNARDSPGCGKPLLVLLPALLRQVLTEKPSASEHAVKPAAAAAARCTSILASSSHMEGIGELGSDLQSFEQCLMWKRAIERLVDVFQRHAARQAFEDEGNREPCAANRQFSAQEPRVGDYPPIVLIGRRLPVRHDVPRYSFQNRHVCPYFERDLQTFETRDCDSAAWRRRRPLSR